MKSAITTTLYSNHNYGAMLQAHALQEYLRTLGVHASAWDFHEREPVPGYFMLPKKIRRSFYFYRKMIYMSGRKRRHSKFERFINDHIILKNAATTSDHGAAPLCDLLVCGSDQIWNPHLPFCPEFFLRFGNPETPRIAYAPSFGSSEIPVNRHAEIKSLLEPFDLLSCRESKGCRFLSDLLQRDVTHVVDPTLLHSKEYWSSLAKPVPDVPENYLLVYVLDANPALKSEVGTLSKLLGLPIIVLDVKDDLAWKNAAMTLREAGPCEFLSLFSNASFIVTNSYHGNIFSIIFEKQFYSPIHRYSNHRMADLLDHLEIIHSQRFDWVCANFRNVINYENLNATLKRMRTNSYDYLKSALALAL